MTNSQRRKVETTQRLRRLCILSLDADRIMDISRAGQERERALEAFYEALDTAQTPGDVMDAVWKAGIYCTKEAWERIKELEKSDAENSTCQTDPDFLSSGQDEHRPLGEQNAARATVYENLELFSADFGRLENTTTHTTR